VDGCIDRHAGLVQNKATRAIHAGHTGMVQPLTPALPAAPPLPVVHVDEREAVQIRRATQRIPTRGQLRTAHRKQLLGTKTSDVESRFVSFAMTNRKIDVLAREIDV